MLVTKDKLKSIDPKQLLNSDVYIGIREYVLELDATSEAGEASSAFKILFDLVSKALDAGMDQEMFDKYSGLLNVLKANCLWVMGINDVNSFFASSILTVLSFEDIDFKQKLKNLFATYGKDAEEKKRLCDELNKSLMSNEQILGKNQIEQRSKNLVSATVKNWLSEYDTQTGIGKKREQIDRATFGSQNANASRLDAKDRNVLMKILEIYDYLKSLSGSTPAIVGSASPADVKKEQATAVNRQYQTPTPKSPPTQGGQGKIMSRETVDAVTASPESMEQLQKTSRMAYRASAQSLSQAIVNAGQEKSPEGEMRIGQKRGGEEGNKFIQDKKPVPEKSMPAPQPLATVAKTPDPTPKSVAEGVGEILKKRAVPEYKQEKSQPANVINLSKKIPLNIARITNPEDLSKIGFSDVNSIGFDGGLNAIGQKVEQLSREQSIPKNLVLNNFYKSPLYETYVNMGVAVMNDKGRDQKAAFEKVLDNYKKAGQDYLTRDQFLAVHALKKKLQQG